MTNPWHTTFLLPICFSKTIQRKNKLPAVPTDQGSVLGAVRIPKVRFVWCCFSRVFKLRRACRSGVKRLAAETCHECLGGLGWYLESVAIPVDPRHALRIPKQEPTQFFMGICLAILKFFLAGKV